VDTDLAAARSAIGDPAFTAAFGELGGDRLSRVPSGFAKDHPGADLLVLRDLVFTTRLSDADVLSPALPDTLVEDEPSILRLALDAGDERRGPRRCRRGHSPGPALPLHVGIHGGRHRQPNVVDEGVGSSPRRSPPSTSRPRCGPRWRASTGADPSTLSDARRWPVRTGSSALAPGATADHRQGRKR
jgi:hypothetical protein